MLLWWLFPLALAGSYALTALLRRYALSRSLLDIPNSRSSHNQPTPRGGGMAIVVVLLVALTVLFWGNVSAVQDASDLLPGLFWALFGAGSGVALLGFLDDHGHVAASWRLLGHFAAAAWGLYWLQGLPPLEMFGQTLDLGWLGHLMALLYLVWLLNLYNFMDGIDGIASVEAICVCLGGAVVLYLASAGMNGLDSAGPAGAASEGLPPERAMAWIAMQPMLLLAAAVAGFLVWNFPPARIFMGDAGSGFIGIVLGLLSIQAASVHPVLLWCWLILLGVFIVDATVTLLRRLLRGEKVYQAHRSHAYQFAARRHGSHLPVTLTVLAINLFWLLPLAIAVALGGLDGVVGVVVAYVPLLVLAIRYRAGEPEADKA